MLATYLPTCSPCVARNKEAMEKAPSPKKKKKKKKKTPWEIFLK
jgi:hypothetical protein